MKKFFNENKKFIIKLVIVILLFPIIVLVPTPIGFIPKDIGIAIVGYGGAIIGGFLTLYGVWWTIEDNNKNRKKELELQYCPIIRADIINNEPILYQNSSVIKLQYNHGFFDNESIHYASKLIKIRNVGRGEIKSTEIKLVRCQRNIKDSKGLDIDVVEAYIYEDGKYDFLPIDGDIHLFIGLPFLKTDKRGEIKDKTCIRIELELNLMIEGIFSSKVQEYNLQMEINIPLKDRKSTIFFESFTLKYVK